LLPHSYVSATVCVEAAAAQDSTPVVAPIAPVDATLAIPSPDAVDEQLEAPPVGTSIAKDIEVGVSVKSGKRKGKGSQSIAESAAPHQSQLPAVSASAGSVSSSVVANVSSLNDASSDYLSSSSTSSLKLDDAATTALKFSTFQAMKEGVPSKPKLAGKKENSKVASVVDRSNQQVPQRTDTKVSASPSSSKAARGRSPLVTTVASEEIVKLDALQDPLRLASCAVFLAQPSYATVFEKKSLCFDISHAKCYRWLVPRRSLVLLVDRDAHLLRGVFETIGTVIVDPRKDVPSAMSAYVPITPLKNELFPPISLTRVGHLINLNALSEESPFESLNASQFSTILQLLSTPAVPLSASLSKLSGDNKESTLPLKQSSFMKQPFASSSSGAVLNGFNRSLETHAFQEGFDTVNISPVLQDDRQHLYGSAVENHQQNADIQPNFQYLATSARPFCQPFPPSVAGASSGSSSSSFSFPRLRQTASTSNYGPDSSFYAPTGPYCQSQPEQQQQASFSAGTSDGYSPWGGFDQRIFGSDESPEFLLGGLRYEFQQGVSDRSARNDMAPPLPFQWSSSSSSTHHVPAPDPRSRQFGKHDFVHNQGDTASLSAGIQRMDLQDLSGFNQTPWMPFSSSGFCSQPQQSAAQPHWPSARSNFLDQQSKTDRKH
jgi:hypothetical protein